MFCTNCGHPLADDANFCPECGSPVYRAEPEKMPETEVTVPEMTDTQFTVDVSESYDDTSMTETMDPEIDSESALEPESVPVTEMMDGAVQVSEEPERF